MLAICCLGAAPAAHGAALLPDLVADPPVGGNQPSVHADAQGTRLLMRMDGFVHNRGPGALEIRGSDPSGGRMGTVRQRVHDDAGGFADIAHLPAPQLLYETDDDHRHWHLRHAMSYSLWSEDRTSQVGPSQKVGFCLVDSEPVEAPAGSPRGYTADASGFCASDQPNAPSVAMGVSAGWRDIYSYVLAYQWIDISDVAPGRYWLRADADPDGVVEEADEVNPPAYDSSISIVSGYLAQPVDAGRVPALGSTAVTLRAARFDDQHLGSPGQLEYQIVTPPSAGSLGKARGVWFTDPELRYTPNLGFTGADTFTFAARDASSPYPLHPRSAAVTLDVGTAPAAPAGPAAAPAPAPAAPAPSAALGISGAPRVVYTRTSIQLSASGPGVERGVTWSVDGVPGGSRASGTVSPTGIYRAPASPPPSGTVAIGARSATGASGQVAIRIRRARRVRPAPTFKAPRVPRRGLSKLRVGRYKSSLIAVVSTARTARIRIVAKRYGKRIASCSTIVPRGGSTTCMMKLSKRIAPLGLYCRLPRTTRLRLPGVIVTATMTRGAKVISRRRASAR